GSISLPTRTSSDADHRTLEIALATQDEDRQPHRHLLDNELDIGKRRRGTDELSPVKSADPVTATFSSLSHLAEIPQAQIFNASMAVAASAYVALLASRLSVCLGRAPPVMRI